MIEAAPENAQDATFLSSFGTSSILECLWINHTITISGNESSSSIDAIDLIDHIKRKTGHKLQAEDFRNVRTVDDVVQAVLKLSQNAQ